MKRTSAHLVLLSVSQVQLGEGALSQVEVVLDLRGHLCHAIHCCCDCLRGSAHMWGSMMWKDSHVRRMKDSEENKRERMKEEIMK